MTLPDSDSLCSKAVQPEQPAAKQRIEWLNAIHADIMASSAIRQTNTPFRSEPFGHAVIENFLSAEALEAVRQDLAVETTWENVSSGSGTILSKALSLRKSLEIFHGSEMRRFLHCLTGRHVRIRKGSSAQVRIMPAPNAGLPIHTDERSGVGLAMLLQLSQHWQPSRGGELVLHVRGKRGFDQLRVVPPKENTLSILVFGPESFHSVSKMDGDWTRTVAFADFEFV